MRTVHKIIELHGGMAALDPAGPDHVSIENEPYMRLVIEHVGTGPRGKLPLISVAHYGEQNGDAMRDPEMTFEVDFEGLRAVQQNDVLKQALAKGRFLKFDDFWHPISFRNDYVGVCQEGEAGAVFLNAEGKVMIRPKLIRELGQFARTWDRNIKEQGFEEAYLRAKDHRAETPPTEPFAAAAPSGWRKTWFGRQSI